MPAKSERAFDSLSVRRQHQLCAALTEGAPLKRFHLALGVADIAASVKDYTARLGVAPDVVIPGQYALWRTDQVNLSIRLASKNEAGILRHLGWEVPDAASFTADADTNGIVWEQFTAAQQANEIREAWPASSYEPKV